MESEIKRLQEDLKKSVEKDEPMERIVDILKALDEIKITSALIVSTKISDIINITKKKFADNAEVKGLCKQLIQKWKGIYRSEQAGGSSTLAATSSISSTTSVASTVSASAMSDHSAPSASKSASPPTLQREDSSKSDFDDAEDCEKLMESYPNARKKIISAIAESLSLDMEGKKIKNPVAFPLAFGVEAEIDSLFPFTKDVKGYQNKSRQIFFSLKANAELRQDILDARLSVFDLLRLPKEQLATRAMREKAQKEREDMMLAKRNDYFAITRDQTMLENGLDPNAGGEHTCSKCKGQKTSSYSLQTRSADEPMTVFVTCLTCGKRWRC